MNALSRTKYLVVAAVAGMAVTLANDPTAQAGTTTDALNVQANVLAACNTSTQTLNFGNYDALTANAAGGVPLYGAGGQVTVTCANGIAWDVDLGAGLNDASAVGAAHAMGNDDPLDALDVATEFLSYDLYETDPSGGAGTVFDGISGLSAGASQDVDIWGAVPEGQTPSAGAYYDTVVVTVTFN